MDKPRRRRQAPWASCLALCCLWIAIEPLQAFLPALSSPSSAAQGSCFKPSTRTTVAGKPLHALVGAVPSSRTYDLVSKDKLDQAWRRADQVYGNTRIEELTGLGVAHALHDFVESEGLALPTPPRAVFICGPLHNANIGLVAARHYKQLVGLSGEVEVVTLGDIGPEQGLLLALGEKEGVEVRTLMEFEQTLGGPHPPLIIDVCHGLGISTMPNRLIPRVRKVFDGGVRAVSVGIPLGWGTGEASAADPSLSPSPSPQAQAVEALQPHALISLGLPWADVTDFKGRHYLTGRFMSKSLMGLRLPPYPGTAQFVELTPSSQVSRETCRGAVAHEDCTCGGHVVFLDSWCGGAGKQMVGTSIKAAGGGGSSGATTWMTSPSMAEAEGLAVRLLQQGQARSVDLIPSAHTLSLDTRGQPIKTSAVLVVAHQEVQGSQGAAGRGQEVERAAPQPETEDRLEKLWSSQMLKARAEARNQWDEEVIMSGGDPFFFSDGGDDDSAGKDQEEEEEAARDDDDDDNRGGEDLDELSHSALLGW